MSIHRAAQIVAIVTLLAPPIIYVSVTTARLLYQYPTSAIHGSNPIWISEDNTRYKQSHVHWFTTRLPLRYLRSKALGPGCPGIASTTVTPIEVWTSAFLSTPTLSLEARVIGLSTGRGFTTGDRGERGLYLGQDLVHGVFKPVLVDKDGSTREGRGEIGEDGESVEGQLMGRAILAYTMPDRWVHAWEVAAAYGLQYRNLRGGRHCFEVLSEPGTGNSKGQECSNVGMEREMEREEYVTVRFGCAIDMEKANRLEGTGQPDGKEMPLWTVWLHEMYARWLVDATVVKLKRDLDL